MSEVAAAVTNETGDRWKKILMEEKWVPQLVRSSMNKTFITIFQCQLTTNAPFSNPDSVLTIDSD